MTEKRFYRIFFRGLLERDSDFAVLTQLVDAAGGTMGHDHQTWKNHNPSWDTSLFGIPWISVLAFPDKVEDVRFGGIGSFFKLNRIDYVSWTVLNTRSLWSYVHFDKDTAKLKSTRIEIETENPQNLPDSFKIILKGPEIFSTAHEFMSGFNRISADFPDEEDFHARRALHSRPA